MTEQGEFVIDITREKGRAVVSVAGETDVFRAPDLRQRLLELHESGERYVVVDLRDATFLDSTGLGVLVAALRRFRQDEGDLVIRQPSETIRHIIETAGLSQVLRLEN